MMRVAMIATTTMTLIITIIIISRTMIFWHHTTMIATILQTAVAKHLLSQNSGKFVAIVTNSGTIYTNGDFLLFNGTIHNSISVVTVVSSASDANAVVLDQGCIGSEGICALIQTRHFQFVRFD